MRAIPKFGRRGVREVAAVRSEMVPQVVAAAIGLELDRRGSQLRGRTCPWRRDHARPDAMSMNPVSGLWWCWACGEGGDLLKAIAIVHGKDIHREFAAVLEIAGNIADASGMSISPDRPRPGNSKAEVLPDARRANAEKRAASIWTTLARRSEAGEMYLRRDRGLDVDALLARDAVRFFREGDPALALRALDGAAPVVNVVWRCRAGSRKVLGLKGCGNRGTLIGTVNELRSTRNVAVIVEGVADALTATVAWPDAVVLGAHGAGELAAVAGAAAGRVRELRGRMLIVPHADADACGLGAGERGAIKAGHAARAAGLRLHLDLVVVDVDAKDLNAAWCRGWRPS